MTAGDIPSFLDAAATWACARLAGLGAGGTGAGALATLVRDELVDVRARWLTLGGTHPRDAELLAQAAAKRTRRAAILVDARSLVGLEAPDAWLLLASLRREADLRDAAL